MGACTAVRCLSITKNVAVTPCLVQDIEKCGRGLRIRSVVKRQIDRRRRCPRHSPYRVIGHVQKKRERRHVREDDHTDHGDEGEHALSFLWMGCSFLLEVQLEHCSPCLPQEIGPVNN